MKMSSKRPTYSREVSNFTSTYDYNTGVVVETMWHRSDAVAHTIVDFARKKTVYVLRSCFKARQNPSSRSQFYKDETPYNVFDNVSYQDDKDNYVRTAIARYQKKWECLNMGNDVFAVKSVCVFSDDEPARCFTDAVGEVPCDPHTYSKVLCRNVTFDCYIKFNFTSAADFLNGGNNDVTFELYKIEKANPEKFDFVLQSPWFKHVCRPMYAAYDPFEAIAQYDSTKEQNILAVEAYMLSGGTLYIPTKPQWRVSMALNKIHSLFKTDDLKVEPNMAILVNIRYNYTLDRFIVFDITKRDSTGFNTEVVGNHFHRGSICTAEKCPGFFLLNGQCLIFDKYGLLSKLYGKKVTTVANFGYMDPDDRAYTTLVVSDAGISNWLDIKGGSDVGLCINKNEFYCPYLHHYLLFADGEFEIGRWYDLVIVDVNYDAYIAEVKPTLIPLQGYIQHKKIGNTYEFTIPYEWYQMGMFDFLINKEIGAIGYLKTQITKPKEVFKKPNMCCIQFGKPIKDPAKRPQVRPQFMKVFKP